MDRLIQMGKDLGYEGEKLQDFVKQQQDYERGERIAERELERDRIAAQEKERADKLAAQEKERADKLAAQEKERADKLAAQEKDREIELTKIAAQEKDREIELAKIAAQEKDREIELAKITAERDIEMARIEGIAEQAERDRELKRTELETDRESKLSSEIELEKLKHSFEMKHLELIGQLEVQRATFKTELEKQKSEKLVHARDPKLPYFEESKDKMDSYLSRFEKYATANKWDKNVWAAYLSALLKGRALDVYDRLSTEDAADYDKLKDALLKNFDMTERGFRKKFRYSRPERSETFIQFSSRLCSYLNKWLTMAKVEKSFEAVCDFMARDQFLEACSRELFVHLKPKAFENLDAMAKEADLFAEARGGVFSCVNKGQRYNNKAAAQSKPESKPSGKPEIKCGICGKGHLTIRCYKNPDRKQAYSAEVASGSSASKGSNSDYGGETEQGTQKSEESESSRGRGYTRGRGRGYFRGRGKTDGAPRGGGHQMSFCQTEVSRESDDGIESIYQSKIDSSLNSDSNVKEGVCYFLKSRLTTAEGTVNSSKVEVLRDTGCTCCTVKRSLVSDDQLTGKESYVSLIDETTQKYPLAVIDVDCPFFIGKTEALCIEDTLYDLVIGNIDGSKLPDMSHFSAAAVTRSQAKPSESACRKIKVPDQIINEDKEALKQAQATDPNLDSIRGRVESGSITESRGLNRGETKFVRKKGLLYRQFTKGNKVTLELVIPGVFREKVLRLAHETLLTEHLGIKKTLDRVVSEFFWPGVCGDVARFCKSCDICQRTIQKGRITKVPLGKMPLIDTPFKRVAVDIVGPIEPRSDKKSRYILTMIDYATRYPEAVALPSIETERVAEALIAMFSRVGIPSEMLIEHESRVTIEVMNEVSRLLLLQQLTTIPYQPYSKGPVERFHAMLKRVLLTMCAERPNDWDRYLPALLFAVREIPQESLGFSPFELLYGRNVRGPMQILRELWSVEETDEHARLTYQYVIDLRERLEKTCKLAQDNVRKLDIKQNAFYDKRARSRKFDVGDKVLLLLPSESNKVLLQWNGPYEVLEVVNAMNYKINVKGVVNTYPANMLKLYVERQNVTSYRSAAIDAHCNVKSKDHSDPTVQRVIVDTVTSNNVRCGDVTHGDVTSVKDSPSQVSISERDEELRAEATDPVRSVTPSRGNVKRDVKLTSDVKVAETPKGGDFHLVFDHTYPYSPIPFEARHKDTKRCWILELDRFIARESLGQ